MTTRLSARVVHLGPRPSGVRPSVPRPSVVVHAPRPRDDRHHRRPLELAARLASAQSAAAVEAAAAHPLRPSADSPPLWLRMRHHEDRAPAAGRRVHRVAAGARSNSPSPLHPRRRGMRFGGGGSSKQEDDGINDRGKEGEGGGGGGRREGERERERWGMRRG